MKLSYKKKAGHTLHFGCSSLLGLDNCDGRVECRSNDKSFLLLNGPEQRFSVKVDF